MTIQDLHIAFKVEVDKNAINIGISGSPSFLPEEIDHWLYTALLNKISTKFTGNNQLSTPFEGSVKRVSDLEDLVHTDKGVALLPESDTNRLVLSDFRAKTSYAGKVQDKRMFFVSAILNFGANKKTTVNLINHTQANNFLETYNNKPWIPTPVGVLEDNSMVIYVDKDIVNAPYSLDLTYVKYPIRINNEDITSGMHDIPEYMQYEVIRYAAMLAIENIESPRTQTNPQISQNVE